MCTKLVPHCHKLEFTTKPVRLVLATSHIWCIQSSLHYTRACMFRFVSVLSFRNSVLAGWLLGSTACIYHCLFHAHIYGPYFLSYSSAPSLLVVNWMMVASHSFMHCNFIARLVSPACMGLLATIKRLSAADNFSLHSHGSDTRRWIVSSAFSRHLTSCRFQFGISPIHPTRPRFSRCFLAGTGRRYLYAIVLQHWAFWVAVLGVRPCTQLFYAANRAKRLRFVSLLKSLCFDFCSSFNRLC